MTEQLYINDKGLSTWGAFIQPGTLEAFLSPPAMKPYVENSYRSQHGVEVLIKEPRVDKREFTINIFVSGISNYNALLSELQSGKLTIRVPELGFTCYCHLASSPIKMKNYSTKAFTMAVTLSEPNPKNRIYDGA